MAGKIDTVRAREALKPRHTPYWQRVRKGGYLGLRKTASRATGSWLARHRNEETGKQAIQSLGYLENVTPADRFDAAKLLAEDWFAHRGSGGNAAPRTVGNACDECVQHLRDAGRLKSADDAMARFKRWVYPDAKFAPRALQKLTPKIIEDWRRKLALTPARQPANAIALPRVRSPSSLNRDMTSLRAALNLALENRHVTSDHAWRSKLRPVRDADGRRDVYLDIDQRRALIAHAPPDLAAFLGGLALLPLRPGALAALTASAFDQRLATLTIGKDKSGRDRRITLPDGTAKFFAEQSLGKQPCEPLICRANGTAWNMDSWKKPLTNAANEAKLPAGTVACFVTGIVSPSPTVFRSESSRSRFAR